MKIGIDARFALGIRRGIGVYSLNLIQQLARLDASNEYLLFTASEDDESVLPKQANFTFRRLKPSLYPAWEQMALPVAIMSENLDVIHCLGNTSPLWGLGGAKVILTLHDVSFMKSYDVVPKSPILYQRFGRLYRKNMVPPAAKLASRIITVSDFARKDILSHLPRISPERVSVTHLAPHPIYRKLDRGISASFVNQRFQIERPFLLTLGGRDPQKNLEFTLRNYLELKAAGHLDQQLVIVGLTEDSLEPYQKLVADFRCHDDVRFIAFVKPDELVYLYNAAYVFIFASLYESFGLPPLEALSCGAPTLLSTQGALPEISSDAALYFDPRADAEFKQLLLRVIGDPDLRTQLSQKGLRRAGEFSWEKLARETLSIYQRAQ